MLEFLFPQRPLWGLNEELELQFQAILFSIVSPTTNPSIHLDM